MDFDNSQLTVFNRATFETPTNEEELGEVQNT